MKSHSPDAAENKPPVLSSTEIDDLLSMTLIANEIVDVSIKRLFGEHIASRLIRTQNRELSLRCIAYNMHRTGLTRWKDKPIIR